MKQVCLSILYLYRKIRSRFWSKVFKLQCIKTGQNIGVSRFCRISHDAKVEVGDYFHSNGIRISGGGVIS